MLLIFISNLYNDKINHLNWLTTVTVYKSMSSHLVWRNFQLCLFNFKNVHLTSFILNYWHNSISKFILHSQVNKWITSNARSLFMQYLYDWKFLDLKEMTVCFKYTYLWLDCVVFPELYYTFHFHRISCQLSLYRAPWRNFGPNIVQREFHLAVPYGKLSDFHRCLVGLQW